MDYSIHVEPVCFGHRDNGPGTRIQIEGIRPKGIGGEFTELELLMGSVPENP